MTLNLDAIWAIEPSYGKNLFQTIGTAAAALPSAGPADDAARAGLPVRVTGNTALIRMSGPLVKNQSILTDIFGFTSMRAVAAALDSAAADRDIETIVLVIDSPGGTVDGADELADKVAEVKKTKPVIVQVDGMMASAAYWIGSQASEIYAGRNNMIGSIGVRMMLYDFSVMYSEAGVKALPIDTGEFKSAGAMGTEITERQQADFQRIVDEYFTEFTSAILRGRRGLSSAALNDVADGRVFRGEDALGRGLIDGVQTISETLAGIVQPVSEGRRTSALRARVARMKLDF